MKLQLAGTIFSLAFNYGCGQSQSNSTIKSTAAVAYTFQVPGTVGSQIFLKASGNGNNDPYFGGGYGTEAHMWVAVSEGEYMLLRSRTTGSCLMAGNYNVFEGDCDSNSSNIRWEIVPGNFPYKRVRNMDGRTCLTGPSSPNIVGSRGEVANCLTTSSYFIVGSNSVD